MLNIVEHLIDRFLTQFFQILLCEMYVKRIIHEIYPTEKQRLSASAQVKWKNH